MSPLRLSKGAENENVQASTVARERSTPQNRHGSRDRAQAIPHVIDICLCEGRVVRSFSYARSHIYQYWAEVCLRERVPLVKVKTASNHGKIIGGGRRQSLTSSSWGSGGKRAPKWSANRCWQFLRTQHFYRKTKLAGYFQTDASDFVNQLHYVLLSTSLTTYGRISTPIRSREESAGKC